MDYALNTKRYTFIFHNINRMPYGLEHWGKKAIVVNTMTGKHFSEHPIPIKKAEAQMRLLYGIEHGMKVRHKK